MLFQPIVIGAASFLIIGLFHPVVIKTEYHFGDGVWPLFLIGGLFFCALSIFWELHLVVNTIFALIGFCSLWSIGELKEQRRRVERGWFPVNPKKKSSKPST